MPPAVHTEISPRLALASAASILASVPTMRVPVAANGMAECHAAALDVQFGAVDAAQRRWQAQRMAAVVGRLPRLERAQHLRREGLVDLVVIEVLQRDARHRAASPAPRRPAPSAALPCRSRSRPPTPCRSAGRRAPAGCAWPPTPGVASSTALAPSVSGVLLPAVSVPSAAKLGRSLPSLSRLVSVRTLLSVFRPRYSTTRSS